MSRAAANDSLTHWTKTRHIVGASTVQGTGCDTSATTDVSWGEVHNQAFRVSALAEKGGLNVEP